MFFQFLIGKRGVNLDRLKKETGTNIVIPDARSKSAEISISGPSEDAIESAITRIEIIINNAKEGMPYTHFVSIPLLGTGFSTAFQEFQQMLIEKYGVNSEYMIDSRRIHMTLFMLKLMNQGEIKHAAFLLRSVCASFSEERGRGVSASIILKGVEIMNDDPSQTSILYAKLGQNEGSRLLQELAKQLVAAFHSAGLLPDSELERQRIKKTDGQISVKFHATICKASNATGRATFDTTGILKEWADTAELGRGTLQTLHISVLGPVARDGYYVSEGKAELS